MFLVPCIPDVRVVQVRREWLGPCRAQCPAWAGSCWWGVWGSAGAGVGVSGVKRQWCPCAPPGDAVGALPLPAETTLAVHTPPGHVSDPAMHTWIQCSA